MAIETPKYKILKKVGRLELREYEPYIKASVEVNAEGFNSASSNAFGQLADYIFGNNTSATKIAMTAPVMSEQKSVSEKIAMTTPVASTKMSNGIFETSFTMPSEYTMTTLPKPNNNSIKISQIPSHKLAVIGFSGYTGESKINNMTLKLKHWAKENNIKLFQDSIILRYNPPWTPGFLRRNEIGFRVKG